MRRFWGLPESQCKTAEKITASETNGRTNRRTCRECNEAHETHVRWGWLAVDRWGWWASVKSGVWRLQVRRWSVDAQVLLSSSTGSPVHSLRRRSTARAPASVRPRSYTSDKRQRQHNSLVTWRLGRSVYDQVVNSTSGRLAIRRLLLYRMSEK